MDYPVEIVQVESQLLLAASRRTSLQRVSQEIRSLLDAPWAFLRARPELRHSGHNVAVYKEQAGEVTVEVGVKVFDPIEPSGDVVLSHIPEGTAATTAYYGPYDRLGEAHQAVRQWCREHHYLLAGIWWEVYGHWVDDPTQLRTDVFYLIVRP